MTGTWLARVSVVAAVGILSAVITRAAIPDAIGSQGPPQALGIVRDSRIFTVGTVNNGTASSVSVPDLGTVTATCEADGDAKVTLTAGLVFDWFVATENGFTGQLNQTSFTSAKVAGSEILWLRNVQGQWRLEYMVKLSPGPQSICQAAVLVTRIS
jgi:hypothetical protein